VVLGCDRSEDERSGGWMDIDVCLLLECQE